jgi:hypothetical protein
MRDEVEVVVVVVVTQKEAIGKARNYYIKKDLPTLWVYSRCNVCAIKIRNIFECGC